MVFLKERYAKQYRLKNKEIIKIKKREYYLKHRKLIPKELRKKTRYWKGKFGKDSPRWNGGIRHNNGYIYIYKPKHILADCDGYVKRANLIWEEHNKELVKFPYVLHHKNRIKDDDRIENLERIKQGEHINHHINHNNKINKEYKKRKRKPFNKNIKQKLSLIAKERWKKRKRENKGRIKKGEKE